MERAELIEFLRRTGCAKEAGSHVFLCDPQWNPAEREIATALMGEAERLAAGGGWLCVRTGGSGGGLKFARHDEATLTAAGRGFSAHFGLTRVNTVGVLPPWHISGLMARFRSASTGGEYLDGDWKSIEAGVFPHLALGRDWVISLVPTQLQRLLGSATAVDWLRRFAIIFLGGGPAWPELAEAAAQARLPISLGYGMTETAAMVTAQRPAEFLAGDRSAGAALAHARLSIEPDGRIRIAGDSIFRGYFPETCEAREFVTEDLGRIDDSGRLHVLGRRDAVIITGGKKVQPAEVEAALRATGEFADVIVVGVPDPEWGERVVACYPAHSPPPNLTRAVSGLASHQKPKQFIPLDSWPRNAQGKINRSAVVAALRNQPEPPKH